MADAPIIEGPGKGAAFFKHARTAGASGTYDYAIELYIQGLMREPELTEEHQALYEISLRRKATGGKAKGGVFGTKLPCKGKGAKEQMLNAEFLLAHDPGNIAQMLTIIRQAAAGGYAGVVRWFAPYLTLANKAKPKREIYLEMVEIFEKLGTPDDLKKALENLRSAVELTPNDQGLIARGKDIAAQLTLKEGKYETDQDFKGSLKDQEQTKTLLQEENLAKSEDYRLKVVHQAKADYEKNPMDHQLINKYAKALAEMDEEGFENEAIRVLERAFHETKTYRYQLYTDNLKMKQFKRNLRLIADAIKAEPTDKTLQQQFADLRKEQLKFELEVYRERVHQYPTDMTYQFEYGARLYHSGQFHEAIGALQEAQNNPKHRAEALHLLGRAFFQQELKSEAIDTLKRAIESYELAETGDQRSKEYHYWLGRAYEETARPAEAVTIYSKIMQWDYNYRDVRGRLETLRKVAG